MEDPITRAVSGDGSQGPFPLSWWSIPSRESHGAFPHKRILTRRVLSQEGLLNLAFPSRIHSRGHSHRILLIRGDTHDDTHRILFIFHITTQKMHPVPPLALRRPTHSSKRHIQECALSLVTYLQVKHERRLIAPLAKQNGIGGVSLGMLVLAQVHVKPTTESFYRSRTGPRLQAFPPRALR